MIMSEYEIFCFKNRENKECSDFLMRKHQRLVFHIIKKYPLQDGLEYNDYLSNGLYGLFKAINTFDINKDIKFGTYASTCINNEIRMMLRRLKKHMNTTHIDKVLNVDTEGHKLTYNDILFDAKSSIAYDDFIFADTIKDIKLTSMEKQIIQMRIDGKTQKEIADILNFSQSYVSRLLQKIKKKIEKHLQ